jgi:pimeloyl-ACP methyl ester carboxylesterase
MTEGHPLLVFPGALGVTDGGNAASLFNPGGVVVTFSYGEERQIEAFLDRALRLMIETSEQPFDVIGFSIGGWFAQCLAARDPSRVRKVVLAHSFTLERGQAWQFDLASKLWPVLPARIRRAGIRKRAEMALLPLKNRNAALYETTLRNVSTSIVKPDVEARLVAQQHVTRDSLREFGDCTPRHPMLIVESDDDRLIGPKARELLRRKYPSAERVVLKGAGHVSALSAPEALASAVNSFLRR